MSDGHKQTSSMAKRVVVCQHHRARRKSAMLADRYEMILSTTSAAARDAMC